MITVDDIRNLCNAHGKRYAVLIAVGDDGTQYVTWGRNAEDKVQASDLSQYLSEDLTPGPPLRVNESYILDAAKNKAEVERLEKELTTQKQFNESLAERVAKQSELLSKRAEAAP